jgi:hypothetical protein
VTDFHCIPEPSAEGSPSLTLNDLNHPNLDILSFLCSINLMTMSRLPLIRTSRPAPSLASSNSIPRIRFHCEVRQKYGAFRTRVRAQFTVTLRSFAWVAKGAGRLL